MRVKRQCTAFGYKIKPFVFKAPRDLLWQMFRIEQHGQEEQRFPLLQKDQVPLQVPVNEEWGDVWSPSWPTGRARERAFRCLFLGEAEQMVPLSPPRWMDLKAVPEAGPSSEWRTATRTGPEDFGAQEREAEFLNDLYLLRLLGPPF